MGDAENILWALIKGMKICLKDYSAVCLRAMIFTMCKLYISKKKKKFVGLEQCDVVQL